MVPLLLCRNDLSGVQAITSMLFVGLSWVHIAAQSSDDLPLTPRATRFGAEVRC